MKLIVGLGNPGRAYFDSRHNIGFMVLKALAKEEGIALKKGFFSNSFSGKGKIEGHDVILAEPLTFMNLSGNAVSALLKKHKVSLDNLLVICDDLDLEFGRIKIRPEGASGGHNGLKSIIDSIGRNNFPRLRIGVGRPHKNMDAADYVLSSFSRKEKEELQEVTVNALDCVKSWVTKGIAVSMNNFNRTSKG